MYIFFFTPARRARVFQRFTVTRPGKSTIRNRGTIRCIAQRPTLCDCHALFFSLSMFKKNNDNVRIDGSNFTELLKKKNYYFKKILIIILFLKRIIKKHIFAPIFTPCTPVRVVIFVIVLMYYHLLQSSRRLV